MTERSNQQIYFLSNKLVNKLHQISYFPVTVVEAAAGFGKTTAIQEYLNNYISADASSYWYTCLSKPADLTWNNICSLLLNISGFDGKKLEKLIFPNEENLIQLAHLLDNMKCEHETFVVFDNYELFNCDTSQELIKILSTHSSPNLHFIFITERLENKIKLNIRKSKIHLIEVEDLRLDLDSTSKLFRSQSIILSKEQVDNVVEYTEGWLAAILVYINNYKNEGLLSPFPGVMKLVEMTIWNKLSLEEQKFLLSVSVMDNFNMCQAAFMLGTEKLPETIDILLRENAFISFQQEKSVFVIHKILRDFLIDKFYQHEGITIQNQILHRVGQSYVAIEDYYTAAQFFFKVQDFDSLLGLPLTLEYIADQKEHGIHQFICKVVSHCPHDKLMKYPFTMLAFCTQMYAAGYFKVYRKLYRLIRIVVENEDNSNPDELIKLKNEFLLFTPIKYYRSANKMDKHIIHSSPKIPFTFGCPSILFLFWKDVGQLKSVLDHLKSIFPVYRRYMNNHGSGAEFVMGAEVLLMQGKDTQAEVLCYRGIYQAKSQQQISICLSGEVVLGRIAILRGDVDGYLDCLNRIRSYVNEKSSLYIRRTVELCLAALNHFIRNIQVTPWLLDIESISKALYFPAIPYAQILYAINLFYQERYSEFIGLSEAFLDMNEEFTCYIMPKIYYSKYLAITYLRLGQPEQAKKYFMQALELAIPDQIFLPLAQDPETIELIEMTRLNVSANTNLDVLKALCLRQKKGSEVIRKTVLKERSSLTPREREVAILVKQRFTAKEISDKLFITQATAKTIIRNIYSKLEIHSRSDLNSLEF